MVVKCTAAIFFLRRIGEAKRKYPRLPQFSSGQNVTVEKTNLHGKTQDHLNRYIKQAI